MARIRCHYADCVFLDDGYCSAAAIELDPDTGCATYTPTEDAAKEDWSEDDDRGTSGINMRKCPSGTISVSSR